MVATMPPYPRPISCRCDCTCCGYADNYARPIQVWQPRSFAKVAMPGPDMRSIASAISTRERHKNDKKLNPMAKARINREIAILQQAKKLI